MKKRLSFRQKIWVSLGVAVAGLAGIAVAASLGLGAVAERLSQTGRATEALRAVADAEIAALTLAAEARRLDAEGVEAFRDRLVAVGADVDRRLAAVGAATGGDLERALDGLRATLDGFVGKLGEWARRQKALGFGPDEGLRARLAAEEAGLAERLQWFSYLKEAFVGCREAGKNLFLHQDPALAEGFRESLEALRTKLRQQKMEDFKGDATETLGEAVGRYGETFERVAEAAAATWAARDAAAAGLDQVRDRAARAKDAVASLVERAGREAEASVHRTRWGVGAAGVGVAAVLLAVLGWIGVGTTRALTRTVDILKDMAEGEGDLTRRLPYRVPVCSDVMGCSAEECPSYGVDDPCWSRSGTLQPLSENVRCEEVQNGLVSDCRECQVYSTARGGEVDEFDRMAFWFNLFLDKIRVVVEEVKRASQEVAETASGVTGAVEAIAAGVSEASGHANRAAADTGELARTAGEVDAEVGTANATLAEVARAAQQMADTIAEIARSTESARDTTGGAVEQARRATERVGELTEAADRIGAVTQAIHEISEQTRLLALNATIEAARAGEAGKGFAVVAHEIKELARQTAEATGQIRERIEAIVGSTRATREDIEAVAGAIGRVEDVVAGIAAAVEEQSVTTRQIAEGVGQAATGLDASAAAVSRVADRAGEVSSVLGTVSGQVDGARGEAEAVRDRAAELAGTAAHLSRLVERFRV
ncbi:methyl-accepting chemotaxis protein [Deferrisoma sp.]